VTDVTSVLVVANETLVGAELVDHVVFEPSVEVSA